jgi:hypothetical protein
MTTRKKIIVSASSVTLVLIVSLFCCSLEIVNGILPLRDSVEVVWALRTHTLCPIHSISKETDDMVCVIAGAKRSWIGGSGYYWYNFQRTDHGWKLTCCDPVEFGQGSIHL